MALTMSSRPEHPHGRGEKSPIFGSQSGLSGTSPRAWGEDPVAALEIGPGRNIPTGVGRRRRGTSRGGAGAEHPHGRGEKAPVEIAKDDGDGTSPRAWGEEALPLAAQALPRNIPTGVGRRSYV